jgi:hypothetical protein
MISSFETRTPSSRRSKRSRWFRSSYFSRSWRKPVCFGAEALSTGPSPFDDCPSPPYLVAGIRRASPSMGATCSVTCAKRRENRSVRRLLRMLEVQRDRAWHDIVTLDESWFHLSTDYEFVWVPEHEKFPKENDT